MSEEQVAELLPCPFCGKDNLRVAYLRAIEECKFWRVECANEACAASTFGPSADTEERAITAWNTRASTPAPQPDSERMREAAAKLVEGFFSPNASAEKLYAEQIAAEIRALPLPVSEPIAFIGTPGIEWAEEPLKVPEGWRLVPIDLTMGMIWRGQSAVPTKEYSRHGLMDTHIAAIWSAMLAAAEAERS